MVFLTYCYDSKHINFEYNDTFFYQEYLRKTFFERSIPHYSVTKVA